MENPRLTYAEGFRARPALLVRGDSRRITIMRCRPANIRVINRRDSRLCPLRCCVRRRRLEQHDEDDLSNSTESFNIRLEHVAKSHVVQAFRPARGADL